MSSLLPTDFPPHLTPEFSVDRIPPDDVRFHLRFRLPRPAFNLCFLPIVGKQGHRDFLPDGLFRKLFHGYADCLDDSDRLAIVMADAVESRTMDQWRQVGDLEDCYTRALEAAHLRPVERLISGFGEFTRHLANAPSNGFLVLGDEHFMDPRARIDLQDWIQKMQRLPFSGKILRIRGHDHPSSSSRLAVRSDEFDLPLREESDGSGQWLAAHLHSRLLPHLAARVEITAAGGPGTFQLRGVSPSPPRYRWENGRREDRPYRRDRWEVSEGWAIHTIAVAGVSTTVHARLTPDLFEENIFHLRVADAHFQRSGPPVPEPDMDHLLPFMARLS